MHVVGPGFSSFGEGGGVDFCCFQCVPQHVPNSSSLYPMSFALSSRVVTYITSPMEEIATYLFWGCPKADYFDVPIKGAYCKRQKNWTLGVPAIN